MVIRFAGPLVAVAALYGAAWFIEFGPDTWWHRPTVAVMIVLITVSAVCSILSWIIHLVENPPS